MVTARPTLNYSQRYAAHERGTAIFVVVLVITTLTGIGLFAARMASSVDAATGYVRQAAQTQGLSLYAGQLAADVLVNQAGIIKTAMEQSAASGNGATCPGNRGVSHAFCAFRSHVELNSLAAQDQTLLVTPDETNAGSLGSKRISSSVTGVEGSMQIEFLEVSRAIPQPGTSMGNNMNVTETPFEFGVNAWAQIRAAANTTSPNWCLTDAASTSANVQAARLYITVPRL